MLISVMFCRELKVTMGAMNQIEEEKSKLREKTMDLQANLEVRGAMVELAFGMLSFWLG